jgi:hypothetical protein
MAVGEDYLAKMRRAVRRAPNPETDADITDLIEECRTDLQSLGVLETKVTDETDGLILGAVRCYVRWKFGTNNPEAAVNREDYMQLRDDLRKKKDYTEVVPIVL